MFRSLLRTGRERGGNGEDERPFVIAGRFIRHGIRRGLPLRGSEFPKNRGAMEAVVQGFIRGKGQGDGVVFAEGETRVTGGAGCGVSEVELHIGKEGVCEGALVLVDGEGGVPGERGWDQSAEEAAEERMQLRGKHGGEAVKQGHKPHDATVDAPKLGARHRRSSGPRPQEI
ncbi:hypothetical protein L7F22_043157 [Adiantum nelumboides]|nr:hypothetical protein [Adiantum nelumboides]